MIACPRLLLTHIISVSVLLQSCGEPLSYDAVTAFTHSTRLRLAPKRAFCVNNAQVLALQPDDVLAAYASRVQGRACTLLATESMEYQARLGGLILANHMLLRMHALSLWPCTHLLSCICSPAADTTAFEGCACRNSARDVSTV